MVHQSPASYLLKVPGFFHTVSKDDFPDDSIQKHIWLVRVSGLWRHKNEAQRLLIHPTMPLKIVSYTALKVLQVNVRLKVTKEPQMIET